MGRADLFVYICLYFYYFVIFGLSMGLDITIVDAVPISRIYVLCDCYRDALSSFIRVRCIHSVIKGAQFKLDAVTTYAFRIDCAGSKLHPTAHLLSWM